MPVYRINKEIIFPHPSLANEDGLLAVGGDLSVERLMLAYSNGIFPWYNAGEPILWWSPNPRCVLYPEKFKLSKSLKQSIRRENFKFSINQNFEDVVNNCAVSRRKIGEGTWISEEMKEAYIKLFEKGYAVSVETWSNGELVGGLYGIYVNSVFSGESMFYKKRDASKAALYFLSRVAEKFDIKLIDAQQSTQHLLSLGAEEISRQSFLEILANNYPDNDKSE